MMTAKRYQNSFSHCAMAAACSPAPLRHRLDTATCLAVSICLLAIVRIL